MDIYQQRLLHLCPGLEQSLIFCLSRILVGIDHYRYLKMDYYHLRQTFFSSRFLTSLGL